MGVEYISAEQRPVSVRTGGLSVAGERCFAFFYTRKLNPKILRCPMSDLPLSPLLDIESNLSPLPDRLRLLAECVEDERTPYIDAVSGLLLESAARIESQLEQLRALCHLLPAQAERGVHHA